MELNVNFISNAGPGPFPDWQNMYVAQINSPEHTFVNDCYYQQLIVDI